MPAYLKFHAIQVPESFHIDLILLGQERVLLEMRRMGSPPCGCIEIKEHIIQHRDLVVVRSRAFDDSFM